MIGALYTLLGLPRKGAVRHSRPVAETELRIAACVLLLEIAHADHSFSAAEESHVINFLRQHFGLADDIAAEFVEIGESARRQSIDHWQFTKLMRRNYPIEKRLSLVEAMWHLIYADGRLEKYEDALIHKLADLLGLSHEQMIAAKLAALGSANPPVV